MKLKKEGVYNWSFNTASVLIQQYSLQKEKRKNVCFNTASVLIQQFKEGTEEEQEEFQYSFCSYSTILPKTKPAEAKLFQYSFCSYSTNGKPVVSTTDAVSIQLLFLFNADEMSKKFAAGGFNTASVLIQQRQKAETRMYALFQYSFCSYSTMCMRTTAANCAQFQYSFCSYSTVLPPLIEAFQNCFNTASVLIQPHHFQTPF